MLRASVPALPSSVSLLPFFVEFRGPSVQRERKAASAQRGRSKPRRTGHRRYGTRVLLFGSIRELALYRAEVLRSHGFSVTTPLNKEEAVAAIRRSQFDVAILTYTLSSETIQELAELIREYCADCPIVAISNSKKEDREIQPDEIVIANDGPPALIAALRRVTRRS